MKNPYAIGSKVYLRAPSLEDAEGPWYEWFSDPETTKYLADRYLPNSKENQVSFFHSLNNSYDRVVFSICKIDNDEHIGVCGLSAINWFHGYADIAYIIGKKQEDNAEAADVFGMVPIRISTTSMSKFAIVDEITTSLKCPELAVGDIVINEDHTVVEVHNKHASLAVRSFNSKDIDASIIES